MSAADDARWALVEELLLELASQERWELADGGQVEARTAVFEGEIYVLVQYTQQGDLACALYTVSRSDVEAAWKDVPSVGAWLPIEVVRIVSLAPAAAAWLREALR